MPFPPSPTFLIRLTRPWIPHKTPSEKSLLSKNISVNSGIHRKTNKKKKRWILEPGWLRSLGFCFWHCFLLFLATLCSRCSTSSRAKTGLWVPWRTMTPAVALGFSLPWIWSWVVIACLLNPGRFVSFFLIYLILRVLPILDLLIYVSAGVHFWKRNYAKFIFILFYFLSFLNLLVKFHCKKWIILLLEFLFSALHLLDWSNLRSMCYLLHEKYRPSCSLQAVYFLNFNFLVVQVLMTSIIFVSHF